jgi:riboflavin synthase
VVEVRCVGGEPLAAGESVAVQGVCLTVVAPDGEGSRRSSPKPFANDTEPCDPARRSTSSAPSSPAAASAGTSCSVTVDATTSVVAILPGDGFQTVRFALPGAVTCEIASKGSVAVDGVSLTVAALGKGWFEVALIPTTISQTTLGKLRPGDRVNLETDVLAKYVRRAVGGQRPDLESLLTGLSDETD